jgi:L-asparaginase II
VNPVIVEVQRGKFVESIHRGSLAIVDAVGRTVFSCGAIDAAVFPRSAAKPLQAMPLLASGAADRLRIEDREVALACGSHGGEPEHVAGVTSMLRKAGLDASSLECGTHWPLDESAARQLAASGALPIPLHNNCSGKHAGFICVAVARGHDPVGYSAADHPVMREVTSTLAMVTSTTLDESNRAIDGCSIPTHALPLRSLAVGFARLGTGDGLPPELAAAAGRIRSAMAACPTSIAGTGRFDTRIASACGGDALTKSGAEGVAACTIPAAGLGIAVKIDDGAGRAAEAVMAAVLCSLLGEAFTSKPAIKALFDERMEMVLRNWRGVPVGRIRPRLTLPFTGSGKPF